MKPKMRIFLQNKLWRDKLINAMEQMGSVMHWRKLNDDEYDHQLRLKIVEEAQEVHSASSKKELLAELADVCEVIDSLCVLHGFSWQDIKAVQEKKRTERGGFAERKFVEKAEHPVGSLGEKYCLEQPHKYPEIIQE